MNDTELRWGVKPRLMPTERKHLSTSEKTITNDDAPEDLNEVRLLRGGSAILFANQSKKNGEEVASNAKEGKSILSKDKKDMPDGERISLLNDALTKLFDAQIAQRKQIGNLVGIALTSALVSERSEKQLKNILRRK